MDSEKQKLEQRKGKYINEKERKHTSSLPGLSATLLFDTSYATW